MKELLENNVFGDCKLKFCFLQPGPILSQIKDILFLFWLKVNYPFVLIYFFSILWYILFYIKINSSSCRTSPVKTGKSLKFALLFSLSVEYSRGLFSLKTFIYFYYNYCWLKPFIFMINKFILMFYISCISILHWKSKLNTSLVKF